MTTAHPAPSAQPLGRRGLNLRRMPGFVLIWRKPTATESVTRDERENPPHPRHPPAAYSPSTLSRANLKLLRCLLWLQRGLRVVLRTVKDLNKDHISNKNELRLTRTISRLASALQSLFNNQCEKV